MTFLEVASMIVSWWVVAVSSSVCDNTSYQDILNSQFVIVPEADQPRSYSETFQTGS